MKKERINEIWGIVFLLFGLFTLASLINFEPQDLSFYTSDPSSPIRNVTGVIGSHLSFGLLLIFGISAYLIPALFLLWSGCFFLQKVPEKKFFKFLGLGIALFATSTLVAIFTSIDFRLERAGTIGYLMGSHLLRYFGYVGSTIIAFSCLLLAVLLATDFLIYPIVRGFTEKLADGTGFFVEKMQWIQEWIAERIHPVDEEDEEYEDEEEEAPARGKRKNKKLSKKEKKKAEKQEKPSTLPDMPLKVKRYRPDLEEAQKAEEEAQKEEKVKKQKTVAPPPPQKTIAAKADQNQGKSSDDEEGRHESVIGSDIPKEGEEYRFPSLDLLKRPDKATAQPSDNLQENSKILEATLAEFGIEVKVVEVEQGPVITRYELLPAPGVKVNSIAALSDDIALALKATSVRLIIPIPGKSAVGVEVPNSVASAVYARELIDSPAVRSKKHALPLVLGKDTSGKPLIADLTSMPHMLIAGTTGSGKTVCVNAIITGLLYACSPADLKFVMVDPKMVELAVYNKIPHMLTPVVTDVRKASHTLNWVVNEMENRYKLFATVGVRNIQTFNSRELSEETIEETEGIDSENVVPPRLPYIVVIIDELADLMMVAQDKVESAIARLAQLSRAVGIHLILATQRPSVDVITGVIKANFPARVSFKVASKVDSRTVLDASGADKLLGRGDMLFIQPGDSKPSRGQAALIVDQEINNVVKFVSEQGTPEYHPEIQKAQEAKKDGAGGGGEKDELFDEAVAVVLETGQASTSNLQRRLRLGYTRAARIIDQMEAEGLIGPSQGAKPREIYMRSEDTAAEAVEAIESGE